MQGTIPVWALPPSVAQFVYYGEAIGRASRQDEIDDLTREVNRLGYFAFTTPQQRRDDLERRLAQALDTADESVWTRIEADLNAMRWDRQLNIGTTPIERDVASQIGSNFVPQFNKHEAA